MKFRRISTLLRSRPTIEGAGVHLKRAFGYSQVPAFDPFLLLDDFHSDNPDHYLPGFPWHPHRGMETVTYLLEGFVEHGDSMGNEGIIAPGDVQWMTAGSGIIHQEMPKPGSAGAVWGFQFWVNLPARHKMMKPRYREVRATEIPLVEMPDGVRVKVVAGSFSGQRGPLRDIVVEPDMLDVTLPPGSHFTHRLPQGHTCFAYVIEGEGYFDDIRDPYAYDVSGRGWTDLERDCVCRSETAVLYDREGEGVCVTSTGAPLRFLLVSGMPLGEPVAWYGPIVMNTREELRTAFDEFHRGTFVKH